MVDRPEGFRSSSVKTGEAGEGPEFVGEPEDVDEISLKRSKRLSAGESHQGPSMMTAI